VIISIQTTPAVITQHSAAPRMTCSIDHWPKFTDFRWPLDRQWRRWSSSYGLNRRHLNLDWCSAVGSLMRVAHQYPHPALFSCASSWIVTITHWANSSLKPRAACKTSGIPRRQLHAPFRSFPVIRRYPTTNTANVVNITKPPTIFAQKILQSAKNASCRKVHL